MSEPKGFFPVNQDEINKTESKLFFLKEGTSQVRVLPPYSARGSWYREVKEHSGRLNGMFTTATCPRTFGKKCLFCDEGQRLYQIGTEESIEKAKTYRPKLTYLFNVMVYSSPQNMDLTRGVLVLKAGVKVKRQIMDLDQDAPGGWGDITNLQNGFDLRITKKGKDINTEYYVKGVPSRNNLLDTLKKANLPADFAPHDLDTLLSLKNPAEFKQMFDEASTVPGFGFEKGMQGIPENTTEEIPTSPVVSDSGVDVSAPVAE